MGFMQFETSVACTHLALVLSPNLPAAERGFSKDRCLLHPHLTSSHGFWWKRSHSQDCPSLDWSTQSLGSMR